MKKISRIGLLSLVMLLGASAPLQAAEKKQSFFQKHKRKLIAGAAAAAAVGIAVVLGAHVNKSGNAIEKAGLKPGDPLFSEAVAAVGFLGPLGMNRTIKLMKAAINQNLITMDEASVLVVTKIGKALAIYWGVTYSAYITAAGFWEVTLAALRAMIAGGAADRAVDAVKNVFGRR